jgi:hypothetical protein
MAVMHRIGDCASREDAEDWIDANQLGRRNLNPNQAALMIGRRYERVKQAASGRSGRDFSGAKDEHPKTSHTLAKEYGIGESTVHHHAHYAKAVENSSPSPRTSPHESTRVRRSNGKP